MDSTNLNLNLNFDPPDNTDEITRKGEFQGDMIGSESKMAVKKDEEIALVEELSRVRSENTKLTEMLFFLCDKYSSSKGHFMDLFSSEEEEDLFSKTKKRKAEGEINLEGAIRIGINGDKESRSCSDHDGGGGGCCWKRPREIIKTSNVSKVHVKIDPSDSTLVVKDGYQWRKYGQKVTRDNPSPRAYYKCSFAPNCPVKKKVQRSVEDPSLLEAVYEGEHNHIHPNCQAVDVGFNQGLIPGSISSPFYTFSSSPTPSLISDSIRPTRSIRSENAKKPSPVIDMPAFQQLLVEKMANSLSGNPSFTTALAAAISTRILDHDMAESWENTT